MKKQDKVYWFGISLLVHSITLYVALVVIPVAASLLGYLGRIY